MGAIPTRKSNPHEGPWPNKPSSISKHNLENNRTGLRWLHGSWRAKILVEIETRDKLELYDTGFQEEQEEEEE